jgi:hypothetical protein
MMDPKFAKIVKLIRDINPTAQAATPACHAYFNKLLPTLQDHALAELRKHDMTPPRLVVYRDTGEMTALDLNKMAKGEWGDTRSKEVTAQVHIVAAMLPEVAAAVLSVEAWMVHIDTKEEVTGSIADHPAREHAMMFNMLQYDRERNGMMQLNAMVSIIKVPGHSPAAWAQTVFGQRSIIDPISNNDHGRFIFNDNRPPA